jgi:hypothetical protein
MDRPGKVNSCFAGAAFLLFVHGQREPRANLEAGSATTPASK